VEVKLLAVLFLPSVLVLAIAYGGTRLVGDSGAESHARPTGLVWSGRTFANLAQFSHWLRSRGVQYRRWAVRHPSRAGLKRAGPARQSPEASPPRTGSDWTLGVVGGAAAIVAVPGILLYRRRRRPRWDRIERSEEQPRVAEPQAAARPGGRGRSAPRRHEALREPRDLAARRLAAAAAGGVPALRRWCAEQAHVSSRVVRSVARAAWRARADLAWYVAGALLATASAVAVSVWA
jgi:LPXTG-motif cell wall-anchored protein